ncbi:thioredoxin family protein [Moniliophthora roreri MCA 2997]|uniref:Thioredoxin family protein n=1 Tax=Moniliophthora roreri (strain MCA 2997) TaxID=1381753 RepID=V2X9F8_MONRO|nr:thioredoxin family protein [Moniliophthora roreri MCA 2997]
MAQPVKLYVYDLSNGIARQMSLQLTGRQIDGIWHTSIVVYGKEYFYGQGINITAPGRSHHGSPLNIVDLGATDIDKETFNEYLEELREQYTAEKYHLLDFNCNSFTNDVAGFLTGGSIPDYIKDLPTDFLSTPFGAALRPTIDAMYRRPTPGTTPTQVPTPTPTAAPAMPNPELVGSILQAVAAQAQQGTRTPSAPIVSNQSTDSLTSPLHPCNNSASFQSLIRSHKAVVAYFSNVVTCPPCRVIAPVFEDLARQKGIKTGGGAGAAFTKIDLATPSGQALGAEWGVRVMPTFMFFLDGKKISEMKGADATELRTQIDLLLFQAYPPHQHTSLSLPAMQALSLKPILFTQAPALDAVSNKLNSFVDSATWPSDTSMSAEQVKRVMSTSVLPYLKSRFTPPEALKNKLPSANATLLSSWNQATATLSSILPPESLFPLVDMWRLALLDPAVGTWCAANPSTSPIITLLKVPLTKSTIQQCPRPYMLTLLRLLSNAFSSPVLSPRLLIDNLRTDVTAVLVPSLLHSDPSVRTAAASLAFNSSAFLQNLRVEAVRNGGGGGAKSDIENEDWEVEIVSAVIEAIDREKESEDVVHRLMASLGCLLRLSPFYETQLNPLLEVLQARQILQSKLAAGGCGEKGVQKPEVRKLIEEVALKLCP